MTISTYLSIIILNVYRLNDIVKRHRMAKWIKIKIKKLRYVYTLPYWRLTSELKTQRRLKVMKWKRKIFYANKNKKTTGIVVFTPNRIDFKTNAVPRKKEHYIIKGLTHQEDITLISIGTPTIGSLNT